MLNQFKGQTCARLRMSIIMIFLERAFAAGCGHRSGYVRTITNDYYHDISREGICGGLRPQERVSAHDCE